jgi:hypothetical protein
MEEQVNFLRNQIAERDSKIKEDLKSTINSEENLKRQNQELEAKYRKESHDRTVYEAKYLKLSKSEEKEKVNGELSKKIENLEATIKNKRVPKIIVALFIIELFLLIICIFIQAKIAKYPLFGKIGKNFSFITCHSHTSRLLGVPHSYEHQCR